MLEDVGGIAGACRLLRAWEDHDDEDVDGEGNALGHQLANIEEDLEWDVFISYRRSNGAQLASLLKVHLSSMGLRVFLDVDRLGQVVEIALPGGRQIPLAGLVPVHPVHDPLAVDG